MGPDAIEGKKTIKATKNELYVSANPACAFYSSKVLNTSKDYQINLRKLIKTKRFQTQFSISNVLFKGLRNI